MKEVTVRETDLQQAAQKGMDAYIQVFVEAIHEAVGEELTAETMSELTADQITLLAYCMLRDEVMDGGFVQLIHNGYGPFFYRNPFDKAVRAWGMADLCHLIRKTHDLYNLYHEELERDCTDEEFIALFEQHPEFDEYDDEFVENEERWTAIVANWVDDNISRFAHVVTSGEAGK